MVASLAFGRPDVHIPRAMVRPPPATLRLAAALLVLCASGTARAFGENSKFTFTLVRHGGNWDPRPFGLRRIAWEIAKRTSIDISPEPKVVGLADPDLARHPFLVLTGDGDIPPFSAAEVEGLRRHLVWGGFLLVDDASGQPGGAFDRAARREIARVLPGNPVGRIPKEHVLWKSFYLLDGPTGRVAATPDADGIALQGRLAVVFSPDDLQGATARDNYGNWEHEVVPGGEPQREKAVRFGVNLAMYSLCLDYKDDQVHVPFIMKRRR